MKDNNSKYSFSICKDKEQWDNFIINSPQGNLFCDTKFVDAFQNNCEFIFVHSGKRVLLGAMIMLDLSNKPSSTPFVYQGILLDQSILQLSNQKKVKKTLDLINFLLQEIEQKYQKISFSLHPSLTDLRSFQWHNYHHPEGKHFNLELNYTAIFDLKVNRSFDKMMMKARAVRRQEYRKCIKEGFTVEESYDVSILDMLHAKTFDRQGIGRSSGEKFMATTLAQVAISKGFGRLLVCRDKAGMPASASLFLFDKKTAYYMIGANDPDYRNYGTSSFVIFEQLRKCLEQGLDQIDFMGINSPNRGDFKTSFGAIPTPYYHANFV
jgi:hypothetical protein